MDLRVDQSVADAFRTIALDNRYYPAIVAHDVEISYERLWLICLRFAEKLRERGVGRQSLIALDTTDMTVSLAMLFATSMRGARMVTAGKTLARSKLFAPTHFFRSPDASGSSIIPFQLIDSDWLPGKNEDATREIHDLNAFTDPDEPWLYLHSSGSTGHPKYFALSQRVALARTLAVSEDFEYRRSCVASVVKYTSRPFYSRALATLLNAGMLVEGAHTGLWQRAGVNLVFGPARQILTFLDGQIISPRIARAEVSGARLSREELVQLLASFERVTDVYGSGETNKAYSTTYELKQNKITVVDAGPAIGSKVEVIDENDQLCPPGKIGRIRIQNDYSVSGYIGDTQKRVEDFRDGFFYPGDRAMRSSEGVLSILGREDDVANIGGLKIDLNLVDTMIATVPGVRDAISIQNPRLDKADELVAYVEFESPDLRYEISQIITNTLDTRLGLPFVPRNIHAIDTVPRALDGTPLRARCREMLIEATGRPTEKTT